MARIHLTFDNGPHPEVTPRVLAALQARGLTATFFALGQHLETGWGRDLARRIVDGGHRLGNHSFTHTTPLGQDPRPDAVARELQATQDLIDALVDGPVWFRPFGGGGHLGPHLLSPAAVRWLEDRGATCVLWNAVPGDWLDADGWPAVAHRQVDAVDHAVLVLHDILPDAMAHLDPFLAALVDRGHTFTDAFPPDCLPVVDGRPQPGLDRYVSRPDAGAAR